MYRYSNGQISLSDFQQPMGMRLWEDNRWVKKAQSIPWDKLEAKYADLFPSETGNVAKPLQLALGACLIQREYGYSDVETVLQIQENPYLQYFCGYAGYDDSKPPFDPSSMVHFRKRLTPEILAQINEMVIQEAQKTEDSDNRDDNKPDGGGNSGTIIVDATCAPSNIRYPQDVSLLNEARENAEKLLDILHSHTDGKKPRTYRKRARKDYLKYVRCRKHTAKMTRKAIGKQLNYLKRDLAAIDRKLKQEKALNVHQTERLETIRKIYEQQKYMYDNHTHSVENRIVSVSQPFVRPIVRGKVGKPVEFGMKLDISVTDGWTRLEYRSFDAYNEATKLQEMIENFHKREGHYPSRVLADKIYRNRENLSYCKERGIRLSGPALGRPKKGENRNKAQDYRDECERVEVERKFSLGKRKCGMGLVTAKLEETAAHVVALSILLLNLRKIQCAFLQFGDWLLGFLQSREKQMVIHQTLSSGMSIKLNIFDLDYPQKPPICIIPEGIHSVLSFFAFSDDSKSIALICDANQAFCYELSGNLLYKKVFHGIYRNNEVYFSTAGALAFIFSYEFDPCADLDFDDEEYDGGADEDCDDIAANLGVPCSIWKWNMETGELAVLYCFLGAAHMHPTATYLTGKGAFLIHDGDNNQIKYLNCNTLMEKAVFVPITRENQDPPAAFHHYAEMPAMCMIMYSDCCYLVNIESEINGNNGVLKCFTIKGIEKKLKEKGVDTQLHFSTNVAPSSTQFLAFDNNAKTYEWDSENDTIRAKYNEAYYDTAYLYVSSDRSNAFLVHAYNGISQFSSEPLKLEYQYCYQEHDYTVNVTASDETNNRIALAFADLGHEKVIVMNLETYEEKTIFSTIMPSETVVDLSFSHNGDYVLITTQYKCVEFNLITGEEMIVARSAGQERFLYGNYSGKWIEVTVTEGSEEGLPTRCEFYSKVAKYAGFEFSKEWYYIVPYLPEELYTYYVHGNGDIGKEGPHDENGIQRYRLTRGFFLEDRPEFARILNPECYQVDGDSVTPLCFHFGKLEMICVRHKKALASQKGMENLITYMYLDEKMGEAILARDSADLAWVSNLSSATYEILWGVFDRHIGNDKGYYSWNYVAPWQNNKMIGCFETFHVTLIDRDIGELSVPVEYEPGLALAGCDFSNIRANDSVKELIKNTGGVI